MEVSILPSFLSFRIFLGRIKQAVKCQRKEALSAFKEYCYILKAMGFFKAAVKSPTEAERAVKWTKKKHTQVNTLGHATDFVFEELRPNFTYAPSKPG